MNVESFRKINKGLGFLLKITALILLVMALVLSFNILRGNQLDLDYRLDSTFLFNLALDSSGMEARIDSQEQASAYLSPVLLLVFVYLSFRGSQIFEHLAQGESPFREGFAKKIHHISLVLMITDILVPLLLSLLINILAGEFFYLRFGLGQSFFLGLILYLVAQVFYYGIELQDLADHTV